jgi:hypothetical protein
MSAPVPEQESASKHEASKYGPGWARVQRQGGARAGANQRRLPAAAASGAIAAHGGSDSGMREPPWKRKNTSSGFEGDVAIVELRARLALAPDHIPEPVLRRPQGSAWGLASRLICIAALAAGGTFALLGLYAPHGEGPARAIGPVEQPASSDLQVTALSLKSALKSDLARAPQSAPPPLAGRLLTWPAAGNEGHARRVLTTNVVLPAADPVDMELPRAMDTQDVARTPVETKMPQQAPAAAPLVTAPLVTAPLVTTPLVTTPPATGQPAPSRNEIAALVARGAKYFAAGDIAAARLVLRPAALAGDSGAALALGETYDPVILKRLGVIGFPGDLAEARDWYRKAAELGSTDAPQRLDQLAGLDR